MNTHFLKTNLRLIKKKNALGILIFLSISLLLNPAIQAKGTIHSKIIIQPAFELGTSEFETVSFYAGRVLRHTFLAREAISKGEKDAAQAQIKKGLKHIALIEKAIPQYNITAEIRSEDTVYHSDRLNIQVFIPIYEELHRVGLLDSVFQPKKNGKAHHSDSSIGSYTHFLNNRFLIKNLSDPNTRILSYSGFNHTSAKLNITLGKKSMLQAQREITEGRMKDADFALLDFQRAGVILEFSENDLPLAVAADLLKEGERAIMKRKMAMAKKALRAASDELKEYQKKTGRQRSKEVLQLYQEIDQWMQVAENQNSLDKTLEDVQSSIKNWWRRVVDLME